MATLYDQSIPVLIHYFNNFTAILKKGEEYALQQTSPDHPTKENLLTHRLRDDMKGLPFQIQSCSNTAKFLVSRLGGGEDTVFEDDETTFEELYSRIDQTIEVLKTIDRETYNKDWDKEFTMKTKKMGSYRFASRQTYISEWVLPNFFFHYGTAYCILRNIGVPLTAFDFLAGVAHKIEEA